MFKLIYFMDQDCVLDTSPSLILFTEKTTCSIYLGKVKSFEKIIFYSKVIKF